MAVKDAERYVPIPRAKSRTVLEKLSKSSTTTDLKPSENMNKFKNNIPQQPVIKDQILLPPKRTLSKCKGNSNLKSTFLTPIQDLKVRNSQDENQRVQNSLSKSKTTVKLIPIAEHISSYKSQKQFSKSITSASLAVEKYKTVNNENTEPKYSAPSKAVSKTSAATLQNIENSDLKLKKSVSSVKNRRKSAGKSRTSLRLEAQRDAIKNTSNPTVETELNCDRISNNEDLNIAKTETTQFPEKCLKKNISMFDTQKNPVQNIFQRTRSQSLFKEVPDPKPIISEKVEKDISASKQENNFQRRRSRRSLVKLKKVPETVDNVNKENISEVPVKLQDINVTTRKEDFRTPQNANNVNSEKHKRLIFTDVNVFYFNRTSGVSSIPRDGLNSLGMDMKHSHHENMKFNPQKDIFVRRKLFPKNKTENIMESEKDIKDGVAPPSKSASDNREIDLDDDFINKLSSIKLDSPTKLKSSQEESMTPVTEHSDLALDHQKDEENFMSKFGSKSQLRRKAFSKRFSSVNFRLETPESKNSQTVFNKSQSSVNLGQTLPESQYETPTVGMLTPVQRGSESPQGFKGVCGARGMTPLSAKERCLLLKCHGVFNIDKDEAEEIKSIRESRETCGCSCKDECKPNTCECILNDIECQEERDGFPCSCGPGCGNPHGRRVFDSTEVSMHYVNTIMSVQPVL